MARITRKRTRHTQPVTRSDNVVSLRSKQPVRGVDLGTLQSEFEAASKQLISEQKAFEKAGDSLEAAKAKKERLAQQLKEATRAVLA